MNKYLFHILAAVLLLGFSACENEELVTEGHMQPLKIRAEVASGFTRTTVNGEDGFSVGQFSDNDEAGFFTEGGGVGNAPFNNERMKFTAGYFTAVSGAEANINSVGRTLLYYPYSPNTNGRQPIRQANGEVFDFLYSTTIGNADEGTLVASFYHTFSMFIIEGKLGFEKLQEMNPDGITVTMEKTLETVEFQRVDDPNAEIGYKVVFNGGHAEAGTKPDEKYADFIGHYNDEDGKYYIILPNDGVTRVKSINAKDDDGRMHKIPWSQGWLSFGMKYPITLKIEEMVPVINIHDIIPWDGNKELEANQESGINSAQDFTDWMKMYNEDPKNEHLINYGTKVEITDESGNPTGGGWYWRFLLNTDIDLSADILIKAASYVITTLNDVLDGCGHTLSGITLQESGNAALIQTIGGAHAGVENLVIDGLTITTTGNEAVGALAKEIKGGTIKNCIFQNLLIDANSAAGVIAGTFSGVVTIEGCNAAGSIVATGTKEKIFGSSAPTGDHKKGCDVSNVMFGKK